MITAVLRGGLGNQMFQYAFATARAMERKTGVDIYAGSVGPRGYQLGQWGINGPFVEKLPPYTTEPGLQYSQKLVDAVQDGMAAMGYFQNEAYFMHIKKELRKLFVPADKSFRSEYLMDEFVKENSVGVHVRRGDYLTEPHLSYHGVVPREYYTEAARVIARYTTGRALNFYIFTDDPSWVQYNWLSDEVFTIGNTTIVPRGHEAQDIYMMSLCQHKIIANSSFSWWGAFLGETHEGSGVIVAPSKWFAKDIPNDIVPGRWMKL